MPVFGHQVCSSKVYDPNLTLGGAKLPFVGNHPVRFLGGVIQIPTNIHEARNNIKLKLTTLLSRIHQVPVTPKEKALLYRLGVCPRLTWDLTINNLPLSWIESTLDPIATKSLKCWLGLARSADPSWLFLPQENGGLGLSSISGLYRKLQVGKSALLMTSRDRGVELASRWIIEKESQSHIHKFRPSTIVQQIFSNDPGTSYKSLATKSKKYVQSTEVEERLAHAASQNIQGRLHELVTKPSAEIWSKAVQSLPSHLLKFALNAAQDTLPHNANLARWRKLSDACKLCGKRQTLLHILNNCSIFLNFRRYNQRHDNILTIIYKFLKVNLGDDYKIISDLSGPETYLFPPVIAITDLRPDLVK